MMDLGLSGKTLQSVVVESSVRIQVSDVYFIVIESTIRLDMRENNLSLSPEDGPDDARQWLGQLVGTTIEKATADAAGALHVIFDDGARLTVEPDPAFEAWNVSGPDGALVVSTAGGELAVWKPQ